MLDRMDVKLMRASLGESGWDVFSLDYIVNQPIHVVFSTEAMEQY